MDSSSKTLPWLLSSPHTTFNFISIAITHQCVSSIVCADYIICCEAIFFETVVNDIWRIILIIKKKPTNLVKPIKVWCLLYLTCCHIRNVNFERCAIFVSKIQKFARHIEFQNAYGCQLTVNIFLVTWNLVVILTCSQ